MSKINYHLSLLNSMLIDDYETLGDFYTDKKHSSMQVGSYIDELEQQLIQKDAIIKVLTEAVEFYGDKNKWFGSTIDNSDRQRFADINHHNNRKGGKRARQALEEIKQLLNKGVE